MSNTDTKDEQKHWETYEIQNPDGSWTTVGDLIDQERKAYVRQVLPEKVEHRDLLGMPQYEQGIHVGRNQAIDQTIRNMEASDE